jgi:hypothetical protein
MQIDEEDEFSRYLRLRWTRGDADRYVRPDAERYMRPDREHYVKIQRQAPCGGVRIRTTPEGVPVGNIWDGAHRSYNTAVQELSERFIQTNNLTPEIMTPDDAWALLKEIRETDDPRIRNFNRNIRLLRRLIGVRVGRGTE